MITVLRGGLFRQNFVRHSQIFLRPADISIIDEISRVLFPETLYYMIDLNEWSRQINIRLRVSNFAVALFEHLIVADMLQIY